MMTNNSILTAVVATAVFAYATVITPTIGVAAERTVQLAGWAPSRGHYGPSASTRKPF